MRFLVVWRLIAMLLPAASLIAADALVIDSTVAPAAVTTGPTISKPTPGTPQVYPSAFRKTVPTSVADLKAIEAHVKSLVARVSPAVVSVSVGAAEGSAVVISEDGLVLCAAHVCGWPDREARFTFPNGKTAKGRTLGTNHEQDAGLMKITDPGPWPHVTVGNFDAVRMGDWVLALGHPGGFDPQRPIVARLGRVITFTPGLLQTDCTVLSGDSGGPLFDMSGRVIAIHSSISESAEANFHVPISNYLESWDRLAKGESWGDRRPPRRAYVGAWGVDDPAGCRLERIATNGPAASAGLKIGDVVTKVNDQEIKGFGDFIQSLNRIGPGKEATLRVKRDDAELTVSVMVEARRRGRGPFPPSP